MDNNILRQLYEGKIYPNESIGIDNPELQEMSAVVGAEKEKFIKSLSDTDRENFLKLDDLLDESASLYGYENFAYGFKLAVSLLMEAKGGMNS